MGSEKREGRCVAGFGDLPEGTGLGPGLHLETFADGTVRIVGIAGNRIAMFELPHASADAFAARLATFAKQAKQGSARAASFNVPAWGGAPKDKRPVPVLAVVPGGKREGEPS